MEEIIEKLESIIANAETTRTWSDSECFDFTKRLAEFINGLYFEQKEELIDVIQETEGSENF